MSELTIEGKNEVEIKNKALIQKACDAWKVGAGTPYDLLAEDMTWTIVGETVVPAVYTSKASFIDTVIKPFAARIDGRLIPTIHAIYAEGASVALHAQVDGIAKDGKPYHNTYAWFLDLENGKVTKVVAFINVAAFNDLFRRVRPL